MDINLSYALSKITLNEELAKSLRLAVDGLFNDMRYLDPLELNISEYNQRYLKGHLQSLPIALQRYAWILGGALSQLRKPLADTVFIEYGGGTGFLSLLAKRLGIGTVIYNDIYDVSCRDSEGIARTLGCVADYYVEGVIDDLVAFCNKHNIKCDSMGSNAVLEHIYDIDNFLSKLQLLSHEGTTMVHATDANMFFYPYAKSVSKQQKEVETRDRQRQWGWKERDCLSAYQNERKKIITSYMPNLNDDEIECLAKVTRGLMHNDILKAVDGYVHSRELPTLIEHPTNTCDPYTGNWTEHLMNPYYLVETLVSNGFDAKVLPVFWAELYTSSIRNLPKLFNYMIRISNTPLYFSRGYALYAQYSGFFSHQTHRHHIYKCRRSHLWWYFMSALWKLLYGLYDLYKRITQTNCVKFLLNLRK